MGDITISQEKLDEIINATIKAQNENALLKLDNIATKRELDKAIKIRDVQDKILNQYSEYNGVLGKEITKLKNFIVENFEEFKPHKDDVDIEKDMEHIQQRDDLSASFVSSDGRLYSAQSIFDISIILLKKLKELKDKGYGSFLSDGGGDNSEV